MNLMELLQLVDDRLRPLVGADESALQDILEEVAAGRRPVGVAPDVEPRAILAAQLVSIEEECRLLREHLHVQLTVAARLEIKGFMTGPSRPRSAPASPNEPE
jgi:hypothetical protein